MGRRRARYSLRLTSGIVVDRRLSAAAKLRAGVSAFLPGNDAPLRALEDFLPFEAATLVTAARQLESLGLARLVHPERPRGRLIVQPIGVAEPGRQGRHRYATIGPDLAHAAFTAASGRSGTAYAPLVLQRLLREQLKRGSAHIAPSVLAADLGINVKLAVAVLDDLELGGVIERHRAHEADSDELRAYSVPLAEEYPIDLSNLDEDQSRLLERVVIERHELAVIGRRRDLTAVPLRLSEIRQAIPAQVIEAAVAAAASANISGSAFLVGDLLDVLSRSRNRVWPITNGDLADHESPFGPSLLKPQASSIKHQACPAGTDAASGVSASGIDESLDAALARIDAEYDLRLERERQTATSQRGEGEPTERSAGEEGKPRAAGPARPAEPAILDVRDLSPEEYARLTFQRN